jgi:hypothetical protein
VIQPSSCLHISAQVASEIRKQTAPADLAGALACKQETRFSKMSYSQSKLLKRWNDALSASRVPRENIQEDKLKILYNII